jgi:hypothetical protein
VDIGVVNGTTYTYGVHKRFKLAFYVR